MPRTRKRAKPTSRALIYLYCLCLIAAAGLLYFTVFTKAYSPAAETNDPTAISTPRTPETPGTTDMPSTIEYKTYPDTGEKVATVLIDAGHGGMDSGKPMTNGIYEKDLNLQFALKMGKYLEELNPQIDVKYIRTDDDITWDSVESEDLNYRLNQQWETGADYFISLHCNAYDGDSSVEGTVMFINPTDTVTSELAQSIRDNLSAIDWADNYQIIDNQLLQLVSMSDIHSILIELGYMTNPDDLANLTSEERQDAAAKALAAAVSDYIMENPDAPEFVNPNYRHGERIKKDSETSSDASSSQSSSESSSASSLQNSSAAQ